MKEQIITLLSELPDGMATFLMAMIPVTELRASIPVAITMYDMAPLAAFAYSVLGNVCAGIIVLLFVENILQLILSMSKKLEGLWQRYINRIHLKNKEKFERWGAIALIAFVAIPLPMTGIVTGAVAASIFQIPFRKAIPLLATGSVIAGVIVTILTMIVGGALI
jgi:uncharacterized membrane protein